LLVLPPLVARRSLKPQLNQIRTWVRQGRTDAWIAHQLDVTVRDLGAFKREHDLAPADGDDEAQGPAVDHERDLREEDDALVAAELDAMSDDLEDEVTDEDDGADEADRPRRRGRRGGRRRRGGRGRPRALEGTFDHGEEGYGLWLDPGLQDDPVYAEHWAGHRAVTVSVEPDRIVIRRSGDAGNGDGSSSGADDADRAPDPDEFAA
jgi:hypothetical protein